MLRRQAESSITLLGIACHGGCPSSFDAEFAPESSCCIPLVARVQLQLGGQDTSLYGNGCGRLSLAFL